MLQKSVHCCRSRSALAVKCSSQANPAHQQRRAGSGATCGAATSSSSSSGASSSGSWSDTAARSVLTLAAAACISLGAMGQQPAWSKPALLDLPACNNFKGDGPVK